MEVYPKSITKQCHIKILEQMNNSICRIKNNNEIGLFCNIKYNYKINQVIIINSFIDNDKYTNKISVILNNKLEIIDIDEIIYKDKIQNISIIKIKNNSNNIKYIEMDDILYKKESEIYYNNESIYILQIKNEDILVSYGIIKEKNKNEIIYNGNIDTNYSFIFNLNNNKLIGIHKNKTNYYNKGICFNNIIKEIKNFNNYKEINILLDIKESDINKKIYFIKDDKNDLKKLNENNTELYINNKKEIYKNYIISEKKGLNKIKLKFNYELTNIEYMFGGCESIIEIKFFAFNTKNITNINKMFYKCKNLKIIDFIPFNTENIENMSNIFYGCSSLKSLPDISNWNTKNVTDMSYMFNGCSSLINLPDISKWDTKNVKDMKSIFDGCSSLKTLPDISNWNTKNVKDMSYMFNGCSSLINLPDISNWDTKNVNNMSGMFYYCRSLINLPEITKWDTKNVNNMSSMFYFCRSLSNLPDITKWDTRNAYNMSGMFDGCSSLINSEN